MNHQEIYQLLKYRRQELTSRMQSIKNDFTTSTELDDVLYTLAHETKLELSHVKTALDEIEAGEYGICTNCGKQIEISILTTNPYAKLCEDCCKNNV